MARDIRYQIALNELVDDQLTMDLSEIEVVEAVRGETTFRVRFQIDICGQSFELLNDDRLTPGTDRRLTVMVTVDGERFCLVHGLITDRKTDVKEGGAGSSLEVVGVDRRKELGRNGDARGPLTGTTALIVTGIVASHGFVPDVEFGDTTLYTPLTNQLGQTASDLELINKLAAEAGYEFWVDAEVLGVVGPAVLLKETAHFKTTPARGLGPIPIPPIIALPGAAVLSLNPGSGCSTLLGFTSQRASEVPTGSGPLSRVNMDTGEIENTEVDQPSLAPLGERPPAPRNRRPIVSAGSAAEARRRQDAALIDASWTVNARAETTVHALGSLIRPRDVVSVKGTGAIDDGDYYVWKVTHTIDAADHKMNLELRRNAVGG